MKQYPVISDFIDKNTKEYYPKGTVYTTKNEKRAKELQEKGFLGDAVVVEKKEMVVTDEKESVVVEEKDSLEESEDKKKRSSKK
jgi:hypothetical protein